MRIQTSAKVVSIASAPGWDAVYSHSRLPIVCFALTDDGQMLALVNDRGRGLRAAEDMSSFDRGTFEGFEPR